MTNFLFLRWLQNKYPTQWRRKGRPPDFKKKRCWTLSLFIYDEGLKRPKTQQVLTNRLIPSEVCEHFSYLVRSRNPPPMSVVMSSWLCPPRRDEEPESRSVDWLWIPRQARNDMPFFSKATIFDGGSLLMTDKTTHFISSFTEMSEKLFENGFPYC